MKEENKIYLGDGVYAELISPSELLLTTENGIEVTNKIYLEWPAIDQLIAFAEKSFT